MSLGQCIRHGFVANRCCDLYEVRPVQPFLSGAGARVQERELHRLEALALWNRYQRGEISRDTYDLLVSDIGKNDDDLTRSGT